MLYACNPIFHRSLTALRTFNTEEAETLSSSTPMAKKVSVSSVCAVRELAHIFVILAVIAKVVACLCQGDDTNFKTSFPSDKAFFGDTP